MSWFRNLLKLHTWHHPNTFDRRCTVCGRHEVFHSYEPILPKKHGWWEVFDGGDSSIKPCGGQPK